MYKSTSKDCINERCQDQSLRNDQQQPPLLWYPHERPYPGGPYSNSASTPQKLVLHIRLVAAPQLSGSPSFSHPTASPSGLVPRAARWRLHAHAVNKSRSARALRGPAPQAGATNRQHTALHRPVGSAVMVIAGYKPLPVTRGWLSQPRWDDFGLVVRSGREGPRISTREGAYGPRPATSLCSPAPPRP
jgi:hypothetical protein